MMGPLRLLAVTLAACFSLAAGSARGQACAAPPLAIAGNDELRCAATFGTTDVALSGALSQPNVLNGPILQFCWTTDFGVFTSTGSTTACSDRPGVTIRMPNGPGRRVAHVRLDILDFSGCTDSDTLTVTLESPPVILVATTSQPTVCTFQPFELVARAADTFSSTGLLTYDWDINLSVDSDLDGSPENDSDAQVVGVSGALTAVTVTPRFAGTFTARLNVRGESSDCIATMLVPIQRDLTPTVAVLRAESLANCPGQVSTFHAELSTTSSPASLSWDFDTSVDSDGDGVTTNDDEATGSDVEWVFPEGGATTIRVNAIGTTGCVGTRDLLVNVLPEAVAAFTTQGPGCSVLAVTFTDVSEGQAPITSTWDFGDNSGLSQGSVRTHVYSSPGTYRVQLSITDGTGCSSSTSRLISVGTNSFEVVGVQIQDGQSGTSTTGNRNGFADPGERVRLVVTVSNKSGSTATGGQVRLQFGGDAFGATILDDTANLPTIPAGGSATTQSPHLTIALDQDAPCGGAIALHVTASGQLDASCQSTRSMSLRIGAPEVAPLLGSEIRVTSTPGTEDDADIATAGDVHALVFEDDQTDPQRILMRRYGSNGNFLDNAFQVSPGGTIVRQPRIAWSPATREFAVTWIESSYLQEAVLLQRVDQTGTLVGARTRVDISGGATAADVIWSGDGWIVVFIDAPFQGTPVAWAQRLTPEGFLLGLPQRLDTGASSHAFVRAEEGNGTWAAGLVRAGATPSAILEIRGAGSVGTPLATVDLGSVAAEPFGIAASGTDFVAALSTAGRVDVARVGLAGVLKRETAGNGHAPAVAAAPDAVFVAWQDGADIVARPTSTSGEVVGTQTLLTPAAGVASQPVLGVASDGLFFVAWADVRTVNPDEPDLFALVLQQAASGDCGSSGLLGDIAPQPAGNFAVDVGDVVLALRVSVGLEPVTLDILERGDVAPGTRTGTQHRVIGNDVIDVGDVVVLLEASVGQITLVP